MNWAFVEFGPAYRLLDPPISGLGNRSILLDVLVGGRWLVPLVGGLEMLFRGDIVGFDGGSELAWNLIGGFQYELPWQPGGARTNFIAAYKAFDFDYETGSGRNRRSLSLDMRGPLLGSTFAF